MVSAKRDGDVHELLRSVILHACRTRLFSTGELEAMLKEQDDDGR